MRTTIAHANDLRACERPLRMRTTKHCVRDTINISDQFEVGTRSWQHRFIAFFFS